MKDYAGICIFVSGIVSFILGFVVGLLFCYESSQVYAKNVVLQEICSNKPYDFCVVDKVVYKIKESK